jgi:polyhydroxyalkanoate synthesis regulator phasin
VIEILRKVVLVGIGALSLTKEKAEQLVKELADKGHVTTDEARTFVGELLERGQRERESIRKTVGEEIEGLRDKWGLVTKKDLNELLRRLAVIEEHLLGKRPEPGNTGPVGEAPKVETKE